MLLHTYEATKKMHSILMITFKSHQNYYFFKVLGALNGVSVKDSCVYRFLFGKQVIMWN